MAKRPKHLRKKIKEPDPSQTDRRSKNSGPGATPGRTAGRTMIGPPIVKKLSSFITELQEGRITFKSTLPIVIFLLFMLAAVVVFYRGF